MAVPNNSNSNVNDEEKITPVASHWGKFPARAAEPVDVDTDVDVENVVRVGDSKKKQEFRGAVLLWLAYQSTGVIYGDIGTSPLYVYSSTFSSPPSYDDLLGALSLIIWALTLVVTVKYVGIVLCADDEGEGGSFALYSLITRYANIMQRNPREPTTVTIKRYMTTDMARANTSFRKMLEKSAVLKNLLKIFAVLGVALVIADGVLTPAQSILGAIQGLKVVAPAIETRTIVGISCAVIVVLFVVQPFGTSKIGSAFAPIVMLWLLFNFASGIYNLVVHDHSVLKAFSPSFAIKFFVRNGTEGWKSLGGILLAFTGVEALFADLGAFSARAIRLSWLMFAYPCLLLAYIGQAAHISRDPEAVSNPFFNTVPPGMYYPSLVLSILAAFVGSQAMITGAFQLLSQSMQMSYFPNIKLVHTSSKFHGQIYVPMANYLMFAGTILVTVVYNNTTDLGNAYGVCVVMVTFITTCLVSVTAIVVWKLHPLLVLAGFLVFGTLDCLFLSSALIKIPVGAWFTILVAGVLATMLLLWRFGKNVQWSAEARGFDDVKNQELRILNGLGVFFDKAGNRHQAPTVYTTFLRRFEAQHEVTVFFHLRPVPCPHVSVSERYSVHRMPHTHVQNTFRVVARQGYMDYVFTEDFGAVLLAQLRTYLDSEVETCQLDPGTRDQPHKRAVVQRAKLELEAVEAAYKKQVVYIFGKEKLVTAKETFWIKKLLLRVFVWMRENTRGKPETFGVDIARLVEVGFVKEI